MMILMIAMSHEDRFNHRRASGCYMIDGLELEEVAREHHSIIEDIDSNVEIHRLHQWNIAA